jgi:phosphoribosylglycinamide formyltransferase-1
MLPSPNSTPQRIGVLGSGSGSNMQSIQDAIEAGTLDARIVCVLTDVPNAGILARAARHGLPARYLDPAPFRTKLDGDAQTRYIAELDRCGVEWIVLAGFMRIVKPGLLRHFGGRVLNIHPALLPAFPGLAGWKQALDYGAKVAGCTVHFVDEGTDTGPIVVQRPVPILEGDTPESLHARIQVEEHKAYPDALRLIAANRLRVEGRCVRILPDRPQGDRPCDPFTYCRWQCIASAVRSPQTCGICEQSDSKE